jgi:hypothetical protein
VRSSSSMACRFSIVLIEMNHSLTMDIIQFEGSCAERPFFLNNN